MKKLSAFFMAVLFVLVGCSSKQGAKLTDQSETPSVFCKVVQQPHPLLMGTWECSFLRYKKDDNYFKYTLVKYADKYALYQHRIWRSGRKRKMDWVAWTINGATIHGEPRKYGVRIFVEGNDVYYTIRGLDNPVKMTRVDG